MFANKTVVAALLATIAVVAAVPAGRPAAFSYNDSSALLPAIIESWFRQIFSIFDSSDADPVVNTPNYAAQRRLAQKTAAVCVKEGENVDLMSNRDCCTGLKEITIHGDSGMQHTCVLPSGQREGWPCIFDTDCRAGMKCQRLDNGKEACVDIQKNKEGAACTFSDDCAAGYHCDRSGWNNTCKKTPACAKSGQAVDRANEQECCSGLKMVADAASGYKCVIADNLGETKSCTFDSDCADDYFCYQYYQCRQKLACSEVGGVADYKNGKECCVGLEMVPNYRLRNGNLVVPAAAMNICAKCGDGACGDGENGYNCPDDCSVEVEPAAANNSTEYLESTAPFGKAMLQPGQCQEINCVGIEREINGLYKCNGKIIGKIICGNESDSNSSGYGSVGGGYSSGYSCCGQQGSSGGGSNNVSASRTSPNIKYEPLDIPSIEKCANEGEALVFLSDQKCCVGLRSIFVERSGNPVELCIKNHGQRDGDPCDGDEDCSVGLLCSYGSGICGKSRH